MGQVFVLALVLKIQKVLACLPQSSCLRHSYKKYMINCVIKCFFFEIVY